jgi:hypothetical protein
MIDDLLDAAPGINSILAAHKKKIIRLLLISADEWPAAARSQSERERVFCPF